MGERRFKDDRWYPRYYDIVGPCKATLLLEEGVPLACRIVDVSRDGLGLLTAQDLKKDSVIQMEVAERKISMQVVHVNHDLIHKDHFRVGLRRIGSADNLVNIFAAAGSIKL